MPQIVTDELARAAEGLGTSDLIYSDEGEPRRRTSWSRYVLAPAVERLELGPLRFHDLRHSHVALLIEQNEHPRAIADRLGHTSVTTILDVYGHLFPGIAIYEREPDARGTAGWKQLGQPA